MTDLSDTHRQVLSALSDTVVPAVALEPDPDGFYAREASDIGVPQAIEQALAGMAPYFLAPTVFSEATPEMTIAREEIFGPVLVLMRYTDEDDTSSPATVASSAASAWRSSWP